VFWFLVTCAVVGGSAYYVQSVAAELRTKPQYVMGNSPDLYYLSPNLEVETQKDLHSAYTREAMETIFNRNPLHLDHEQRLLKLFSADAVAQIEAGVIKPQAQVFVENHLHQKVEIGEIVVNIEEGMGKANTKATGQLIRTGVSGDSTINETWSITLFFTWKSNENIQDHAMYPTICDSVTFFSMERASP
jgi:hypothetical protein